MHILFLTDNFPPESNAPASRTYEHCREWVKAGHQVTVVTCAPNFPTGKVFPGYRNRLWQREVMDGIQVIRLWTYITANEGFLKRILDYQSFMVAAVMAAPFVRKVDLVIGTSPQFFTACAAYIVSRYKQIPFVFELRDLWPESIRAVGAMGESVVLDWLEKLELFLYRKADLVVSVTESFKSNIVARGTDPSKVKVVTNGVDISAFQPREKDPDLVRQYGLSGKFTAGYVGTHGMAHSLETILEAAKLLQDSGNNHFRFILLGGGARKAELESLARKMHLDTVIFIGPVPKNEVARYWSLLDVSVIHLRKTELFTTVIPSKLFECMGMGIPVLHGVAGESAAIVEKEGVGLFFEPENAEELVDKLVLMRENQNLYQQFKINGLKAAVKYDRSLLAKNMLDLLSEELGEGVEV